jgi:predicted small integral membrane protein
MIAPAVAQSCEGGVLGVEKQVVASEPVWYLAWTSLIVMEDLVWCFDCLCTGVGLLAWST